jgi:cofilin
MAVDDDCKRKLLELKAKRTYRFVRRLQGRGEAEAGRRGQARRAQPHLRRLRRHPPRHECRYCVYDFDFVTEEGCQKSKIFFIAW